MRWLNLFIIFIYVSILLSSPAKAVTQNRVDVVGSGLSVHHAIMPMAQHLPSQTTAQSDPQDDGAVFNLVIVPVSLQHASLLPAASSVIPSSARLLAQPRAPPHFC